MPNRAIEIKKGLGWIPRFQKPIVLFHVVLNGRTVASFDTYHVAWKWACERYNVKKDSEIDTSKAR